MPSSLLGALPLLTKLSLSRNGLSTFPALPVTMPLKELRLAYNTLSALPPLPPSLVILDVGHNNLTSIASLSSLASLTRLANLNLAGNPVACVSTYRTALLAMCPSLKTLDGRPIRLDHPAPPPPKTPDPREVPPLPPPALVRRLERRLSRVQLWQAGVGVRCTRPQRTPTSALFIKPLSPSRPLSCSV